MKLAIVVKTIAPYRTALYEEVARRLAPESEVLLIAPEVVAPDHDWSDLRPSEEILGFRQVPGRFYESRLLAKFYRNQENRLRVPLPSFGVGKALGEYGAQTVWIHECSPFVLSAAVWATKRGCPLVFSSELGKEGRCRLPLPVRVLHNAVTNRAKLVVAHTKDAETTAEADGKPVAFAPHAIRVPAREPGESLSKPTFTFLHAGSLIRRKGIDLLLKAARDLVEKERKFEIVMAGGKPDYDYEGMARELGVEGCIRFVGFVEGEGLERLYREADCFVLASRYDTYGAVSHEAASYGCPLIISRHAGSSKVLVEEGVNGWVVDPESKELAAQMCKALDGELSQGAGDHSRSLALHYGVERNADRVAKALKELK